MISDPLAGRKLPLARATFIHITVMIVFNGYPGQNWFGFVPLAEASHAFYRLTARIARRTACRRFCQYSCLPHRIVLGTPNPLSGVDQHCLRRARGPASEPAAIRPASRGSLAPEGPAARDRPAQGIHSHAPKTKDSRGMDLTGKRNTAHHRRA